MAYAAFATSSVEAIMRAPSGNFVMVSPWLIQTWLFCGMPLKSGESLSFISRMALPYSLEAF